MLTEFVQSTVEAKRSHVAREVTLHSSNLSSSIFALEQMLVHPQEPQGEPDIQGPYSAMGNLISGPYISAGSYMKTQHC